MTCATCRRLRKRVAEELAKLKAAISGPSSAELARQRRQAKISRRATLKALLAGAAIASGLARTRLELVDDQADVVYLLEQAWREIVAHAGQAPSYILVGRDFLAEYADAIGGFQQHRVDVHRELVEITYKGVPIYEDKEIPAL